MPSGNLISASTGDNQLAEELLKEIKKLREELKDKQILEEENAKLKAELNQIKEKRMEMEESLYFEIYGKPLLFVLDGIIHRKNNSLLYFIEPQSREGKEHPGKRMLRYCEQGL